MAAKRRKSGQWREIAHSRDQIPRIMAKSHGLSNIPGMNETGSAAYRRLKGKRDKGFAE